MMNQINPLHIGVFLVMLLFFSFFKLNEAQKEFETLKHSYKESEKLALELVALKDAYGDKKKIIRSLNHLPKVNKTTKRDSIKIYAKSIDKKSLDRVMSKVLNGNYNITDLKIKKLNDYNASLSMEIKW